MKIQFQWFTLVELIVVITIIAILSAIWFVSYSSYVSSSRDANRISQSQIISKSLAAYGAKKSLPLPQNYIQIIWGNPSSGTGVISYQWTLSSDVLEIVEYENGGKDPETNNFFPYVVSGKKNKFQVLSYLEDSDTSQGVFTSGNSVGVIHRDDVMSTDMTLSNITTPIRVIFSNDFEISWSGWQVERAMNYSIINRDKYIEAKYKTQVFNVCSWRSGWGDRIEYNSSGKVFYTVVRDISASQDLFAPYNVSYNRWPLSGRAVIRCDSSVNWYEVIWEQGRGTMYEGPSSY